MFGRRVSLAIFESWTRRCAAADFVILPPHVMYQRVSLLLALIFSLLTLSLNVVSALFAQ